MEFPALQIPCPHALAAATLAGVPTDMLVHIGYFQQAWNRWFDDKIYHV